MRSNLKKIFTTRNALLIRNILRTSLVVLFIFTISACALFFPDRTAPKSGSYAVTEPLEPWTKLPVTDDPNATDSLKADAAFENQKSGAIISINSLCRKYQNSTVDDLTRGLVIGIKNKKTINEKSITVDNENAKDTLLEGIVDEVAVQIRTIVLKKNFCTYDFIYVALPQKYSEGVEDFEKFVSSFKEK